MTAAQAARAPQPLWALVPPYARGRYLRRTAQAILDELDDLAGTLAEQGGMPRTEALLAELLPSVAGLHELADDGPRALADRRLGRRALLRAGRRSNLFHAPVGVVGIRGGSGSPWSEAVLESAAALLAGNGVVLDPAFEAAGLRLASALGRAGLPDGLIQIASELEGCDTIVGTGAPGPKGTMLVLEGAPIDRTVSGALWAAYARGGRGPASVGRIVTVPETAAALLVRLTAAAQRLEVGDPRHPATEVSPLASAQQVEEVEALVREAEAGGAVRLCGGPLEGAAFHPVLLRSVPPAARLLHEPVPGPVLAVVEAASEQEAIELARVPADSGSGGVFVGEETPTVSVWAGDRDHGERIARSLGAEITWVNEHGVVSPAAPVRLARHTSVRQLASRPVRLRSALWLPHDPALVRAAEAAGRLAYGRESERLATLRSGGPALVRVAWRLGRSGLGR